VGTFIVTLDCVNSRHNDRCYLICTCCRPISERLIVFTRWRQWAP